VAIATTTLCVAPQRVFIVVAVYFVINSVRKILDTHSYVGQKDDSWTKCFHILRRFNICS
jgi:hypothetical protein